MVVRVAEYFMVLVLMLDEYIEVDEVWPDVFFGAVLSSVISCTPLMVYRLCAVTTALGVAVADELKTAVVTPCIP